jgi:hypothetical protein
MDTPRDLWPPALPSSASGVVGTVSLIDTTDAESHPPSLEYTPPNFLTDWQLLELLSGSEALVPRFKIKRVDSQPPDRETHAARGNNENIEYQRDIDRGTNSDVYQVPTVKTRT